MVSSRSKWEDFFKQAGVPNKPATEYSIIFSDNRMQLDMMDELNKELLHDLGVKAMGDVIAILRHAKVKYAEMSRHHSPTPETMDEQPPVATKTKPKQPISKPTSSTKDSTRPIVTKGEATNNTSTVKTRTVGPAVGPVLPPKTIKDQPSTSKTSKSRKTLSSRFNEFEEDKKRKKIEEETEKLEDVKKLSEQSNIKSKGKSKGTVFTIQVPSKPPSNIIKSSTMSKVATETKVTFKPKVTMARVTSETRPAQQATVPKVSAAPKVTFNRPTLSTAKITVRNTDTVNTETKPKTTLVPAQGKQLNRNKRSTSIFDRLDKSTTKSPETVMVEPNNQDKIGVFRRLGSKGETASPPKIQKVTMTPKDVEPSGSSNVFSRLGGR